MEKHINILILGCALAVSGIVAVNKFVNVPKEIVEIPKEIYIDGPTKIINETEQVLNNIAATFETGAMSEEFTEYVATIQGVNYLQLVTYTVIDTFSRVDSTAIMWDWIPLPDVNIEIQAPVEYTYSLNLNEKWEFIWDDAYQGIVVYAPNIRPNTPAIDVSHMKITDVQGSMVRSEELAIKKLQQEITPRSRILAQEKIPQIREMARRKAREFIENWFVKTRFQHFAIKPHVIELYFADERRPETLHKLSSQAEEVHMVKNK